MKVDGSGRRPLLLFDDCVRVGGVRGQRVETDDRAVTVVTAVVPERFDRADRTVVLEVAGESAAVPQAVVGRRRGAVTDRLGGEVVDETRGGRRTTRAAVDPRHFFVAFLLFHPPVLKPYLDLPLGEAQLGRHLLSLAPHDVLGRLEHRLQHGRLVLGVSLPGPLAAACRETRLMFICRLLDKKPGA